MSSAVLIDTNVLVYAHDQGEPDKQRQAFQVLEAMQLSQRGRLSVQCLAEFFSITTRGARPKLTVPEAARQVDDLARTLPTLDLTPLIVLEAVRGVREHRLSYYDAQIWATAKLNQLPAVFSEDFASGSTLEGVRFVNPFEPSFELQNWA
jgi:predicted nucleic acid-binding protein